MRLLGVVASVVALIALVAGPSAAAELKPPPLWQGQTLMGPAKAAADLVKATLTYNAPTKALLFKRGEKTVQMTLGSKSAKINGAASTLTEAPKTVKDTSFVPLKSLFIGLGLQVHPSGQDAWIVCTDQLCIRLKVPPKPQ